MKKGRSSVQHAIGNTGSAATCEGCASVEWWKIAAYKAGENVSKKTAVL